MARSSQVVSNVGMCQNITKSESVGSSVACGVGVSPKSSESMYACPLMLTSAILPVMINAISSIDVIIECGTVMNLGVCKAPKYINNQYDSPKQ